MNLILCNPIFAKQYTVGLAYAKKICYSVKGKTIFDYKIGGFIII